MGAARFQQAASEEEQKRVLQDSLNKQIDDSKAARENISAQLHANITKVETCGLARNYKVVLANQRRFVEQHLEALLQEAPDKAEGLQKNLAKIEEMIRAI